MWRDNHTTASCHILAPLLPKHWPSGQGIVKPPVVPACDEQGRGMDHAAEIGRIRLRNTERIMRHTVTEDLGEALNFKDADTFGAHCLFHELGASCACQRAIVSP